MNASVEMSSEWTEFSLRAKDSHILEILLISLQDDTKPFGLRWDGLKETMLVALTNLYMFRFVIFTQPVKKFPAFCDTRRFITVFTRARHWSLLSQKNPVHTFPPCFPSIYFCIIFQSTPRSSMWPRPFRFSNQNFVRIFHFSHACCMHRPYYSWFDHRYSHFRKI